MDCTRHEVIGTTRCLLMAETRMKTLPKMRCRFSTGQARCGVVDAHARDHSGHVNSFLAT